MYRFSFQKLLQQLKRIIAKYKCRLHGRNYFYFNCFCRVFPKGKRNNSKCNKVISISTGREIVSQHFRGAYGAAAVAGGGVSLAHL